MRRRRGIMGLNGGAGIPVIAATATGNPLTFETDMVKPLKSLVIPFTPIQDDGTPTPDAPLPISGWTGCEIEHRGKNLFDKNNFKTLRGVSNDLVFNTSTAWGLEFPCLPNTTYTFTRQTTVCNRFNVYDCADSAIVDGSHFLHSSGNVTGNTITFKTYPTAKTIFLYLNSANTASSVRTHFNNTVAGLQIEFGDTSTTYNSYRGESISVSWQSPVGIIYGGTLTINEDGSGRVVKNIGSFIVNSSSDLKLVTGTNRRFEKKLTFTPATVDGEICSHAVFAASAEVKPFGYFQFSSGGYIILKDSDSRFATVEALNAWLDEQQANGTPFRVCYRMNPQSYNLTPEQVGQIVAYLGMNNIWTDTNGTNTATYLKHQS